ncbi:carbohydrate-binding protein [Escherichia coli]|uniref:carbohydrate-binding protein n=1 Tax=Escherichia coli TaxID=562 RepID=UPI001FD6A0AF|nr:carbohydrate-binding protein [Escherichia coli]
MSKIVRYQGDVRAFASDAQGMERTVFGGTNQADDLTSQITASFLRGWGIVGASEHPSLEDFNAAMYAMSQFIAYQHQMGVPEWHAEQEYHIGSICTHNGESYQSLQNANIGSQPPSAKWTPVLTSKNGLANLGLGEGANWVMLPGGMIIQRVYLGFPVGTNVRHITFPRSFTTTNYSISINWNDIGTVTTETQSPANVAVVHQTKSLTGASIWQAGPGGFNVDIIAVGY